MKNYLNNKENKYKNLTTKMFTTYKDFKDKFREARSENNKDQKVTHKLIILQQYSTVTQYITKF